MNEPKKVVKLPTQLNNNVDQIKEFFAGSVTLDGLDSLPAMTTGTKMFRGEEKAAVGFVYGPRRAAIKWRSIDGKGFTCDGALEPSTALSR